MDADEKKCIADIEEYGCHVIHVLEEEDLPPFSYTVGVTRASSAPEAVVVGLKQEMGHFVVNEYNRRVRDGEKFAHGEFYDGFLEGFPVQFREVHKSHYREYFGWDLWLYKSDNFKVFQIVYPDTSGNWPWEDSASEWFQSWQPRLDLPEDIGAV